MVVLAKAPSSRPKTASARHNLRSRRRPVDPIHPPAEDTEPEHPGSPNKKQRNSYAAASPIYAHDEDEHPMPDASLTHRSELVVSSRESLELELESEALGGPNDKERDYNVSMSPSYPHDEDGYPLPGISLTPRFQRIGSSPSSPQRKHESPESYDLERPGSPNKKQRNTLETHTPIFDWQEEDRKLMEGANLTPHNACFLYPSPESLEKNWEDKWIAEAKELSRQEAPLGTKFERLSEWVFSEGSVIMRSLSKLQDWHRKDCNDCDVNLFKIKPQFLGPEYDRMRDLLQARSRKLLTNAWDISIESVLKWFKRGLVCKHCENYHLSDELEKEVEEMKKALQKMDPYTVDQAMLDKFDKQAHKVGKEYLLKVKGTACKGNKIIWRKKINQEHPRERADSAIEMTTSKFAEININVGELGRV
ncbi:hypothetical protein N431DRAFT_227327 [Stipitochalara longipes BDJ]|nr:hypothetical protein N431DRAFT_227327 [Stipitochalara longipes BDJ]